MSDTLCDQAGLLAWVRLREAPSRLIASGIGFTHPPYSVGHATDLHRLPDSPSLRRAPEPPSYDTERTEYPDHFALRSEFMVEGAVTGRGSEYSFV
jgi:hypothetical protein